MRTEPVTPVSLHHGAATDTGLMRATNEDAFLVAPPVFVVADGMGGHAAGALASQIVVEEFARLADAGYDPTAGAEVVARTLEICQARIASYVATRSEAGRRSPGTTVVAALLVQEEHGPREGQPAWLLVNLGDSRIYRMLAGVLEQVSTDHSVVQELIDAGRISPEEAAVHPDRHVITRALGGPRLERADYFVMPLAEVGRLLLCTDGITGLLDDKQIAEVLARCPDAQDAADRLVAAALAAGGDDNATAIVIDVLRWAPEPDHDAAPQPSSPEQKPEALP